tara:strand:- start:703 stop:1083 length:381 start_codon:yes stop_codon:yes gene_type:complete
MLGIQIVGLVFGMFMLYFTFLHLKRNEFSIIESSAWFLLWFSMIIVTLFPSSLDFFVSKILNLNRNLDFFIISGFLFLVFATFFNYTKTRKNDKKIQKIVSKIAIIKSNETATTNKKEEENPNQEQ